LTAHLATSSSSRSSSIVALLQRFLLGSPLELFKPLQQQRRIFLLDCSVQYVRCSHRQARGAGSVRPRRRTLSGTERQGRGHEMLARDDSARNRDLVLFIFSLFLPLGGWFVALF
jgi:hypothetical protein